MDPDLEVNLDPTVKSDFVELLRERGFASINEFIIDVLKRDRAEKRRAKHEDIAQRMWPNGAPNRPEES